MRVGFDEQAVYDMPLDKYQLVLEAAIRRELRERRALVQDTAAAIAGAFGKKGDLAKILEEMVDKEIEGDGL